MIQERKSRQKTTQKKTLQEGKSWKNTHTHMHTHMPFLLSVGKLTCFSLGNFVFGWGNLTRGPSGSAIDGKVKRLSAIAWTSSVPFCRHSFSSSSLNKPTKITVNSPIKYELIIQSFNHNKLPDKVWTNHINLSKRLQNNLTSQLMPTLNLIILPSNHER